MAHTNWLRQKGSDTLPGPAVARWTADRQGLQSISARAGTTCDYGAGSPIHSLDKEVPGLLCVE